jgi:glucosamine-6-phosphate deaminase
MNDASAFKLSGLDLRVFPTAEEATLFAAQWLLAEFAAAKVLNVMLPGGNTPLAVYDQTASVGKSLQHLNVFALDEYVGVPLNHPRNCANLIRDRAVRPWDIPDCHYHPLSSLKSEAARSIEVHESKIKAAGGLDLVLLGLGKNGHIGFNEPGSVPTDAGRLVELSEASVNANRLWFDGEFAPDWGVTTGMSTLLAARKIMLLAFGQSKAQAVSDMLSHQPSSACPASFLQLHSQTLVILDELAAAELDFAPRAMEH